MGEYKQRGGFGGNSGSFGGNKFGGKGFGGRSGGFGAGEFRKPQMFSTVCAECGKPCEVPFRPNGEKPVYCNLCFGKNKASLTDSGRGFEKSFQKRDFAPKRFDSSPKVDNSGDIAALKKQLEIISTKLDKLTNIIVGQSAPIISTQVVSAEVIADKATEKPVKAKKSYTKKIK